MPYYDELDKVLHGTIKEVVLDEGDEEFFGLRIELPTSPYLRQVDEVILWFYKDDEGNGPGSFHIQEIPND